MGLAQAWVAARDGKSVAVFERDRQAVGASIRNFGMVWPIGQPPGDMHAMALASRGHWCRLARQAGFWLSECGSLFLAHRDDEWNVLQEFAAAAPSLGYDCQLLTPGEVLSRTAAANPDCLRGGLWSPTEMAVDPREAIRFLPEFLRASLGVQFHFGAQVCDVKTGVVTTSAGRTVTADQVLIAGGSDFETLFPAALAASGLRRCKLQMLRTQTQPGSWRIGPHLASGLTLRFNANFASCPSLTRLKQRIAEETPELDRYGIHVMAAQNQNGEVILGDSHEYGDDVTPFDKQQIDALMLRELRKSIRLEDWTITQRWHGVYTKHPSLPWFVNTPLPGVKLVTGLSAGMTLSFGLAERIWDGLV